ncbi:MAG TPA: HAD family phosphatase [Dehalococcoidia bacterium]
MPALVIFDCDGVLVDAEAGSDAIVSSLLAEMGIDLRPAEVHRRTQGVSDRDMWLMFARDFGKPMPASLKAKYREREAAFLRENAAAIPGVETVLRTLAERAQPMCVASSGTKAKMRISLGVTGLARYFGGNVFSASQVRHGKPAPDLFLFAAGQMAVPPAECVVVEDSLTGVHAGVAAGMRVLAFSRTVPESELEHAGGHVFRKIEELPALLGK